MDNNEPQTPADNDAAQENVSTLEDVGVVEGPTPEVTEAMPVPASLQFLTTPEVTPEATTPEEAAKPEETVRLEEAVKPEEVPALSAPATVEELPKEAEKPAARPTRPARLETALTAAVLIGAAIGVSWGLARPMTLLFPPTQEQAAQLGHSPDCRRVRFDVAQLLGDRWRQTISSCLRGSCENLRESLIARNFPIATWQLLEEDDSGQGCEVNAQGPAKSAECTRLLGRVEGVAKTVLLQVEGECREKP